MQTIFELGKMSRTYAKEVTRQLQIEVDEASAGIQDVRITVEVFPTGTIRHTRRIAQ